MFFSEHTQSVPIPEEYMEFCILWEPNSTYPALPLFLDFPEESLEPILKESAQEYPRKHKTEPHP